MSYYCESCYKENLEKYVIDNHGSVFCSEKCFVEFYATEDFKNHRIVKRVGIECCHFEKSYDKNSTLIEVRDGVRVETVCSVCGELIEWYEDLENVI